MLDGGAMFGLTPKPLWERLVTPDDRNRIPLQQNCVLLERSGELVLIEAGIGDKLADKLRDIYDQERRTVVDALHEIDCSANDITTVIVTHLHFDHAGGLTRLNDSGQAFPTFPNARIISQRLEWEDALANKSTMHSTYLRDHLDPIRDHMDLVEGEAEIMPGISVLPLPGHTWGQQGVKFSGAEGGEFVYPADLMPTVNHAGPASQMAYDMIPYENMLQKESLLNRAHELGWTFILDHEPGHPVVQPTPHPKREGQFLLTPVED